MAKSKKTSLPQLKFTVTTADDILAQIQDIAREEPKRIHMGEWYKSGVEVLKQYFAGSRNAKNRAPECQTIGCVAGWTCALTQSKADADFSASEGRTAMEAQQTLGLDNEQREWLFLPNDMAKWGPGGSRKHAQAFIAHIQAFRDEHSDQLRNRVVRVSL